MTSLLHYPIMYPTAFFKPRKKLTKHSICHSTRLNEGCQPGKVMICCRGTAKWIGEYTINIYLKQRYLIIIQ